MGVRISCPNCGEPDMILDHVIGAKARCNVCQAVFDLKPDPPGSSMIHIDALADKIAPSTGSDLDVEPFGHQAQSAETARVTKGKEAEQVAQEWRSAVKSQILVSNRLDQEQASQPNAGDGDHAAKSETAGLCQQGEDNAELKPGNSDSGFFRSVVDSISQVNRQDASKERPPAVMGHEYYDEKAGEEPRKESTARGEPSRAGQREGAQSKSLVQRLAAWFSRR